MVHIQPSLIKLASNTPTAFNIILKYLNHEDKRKLFLTSKQLQDTLKMYQQLKQFTSQTITFRFPQTPFHKKGKPHYGKPNNIKPIFITKHVNPQASLTECHTCDTLYYNAKFEKTFLSCDQHAKYRWEKANPTDTINNRRMIIAEKTPRKKGHRHTSKQPFFPICNQFIPRNQNPITKSANTHAKSPHFTSTVPNLHSPERHNPQLQNQPATNNN